MFRVTPVCKDCEHPDVSGLRFLATDENEIGSELADAIGRMEKLGWVHTDIDNGIDHRGLYVCPECARKNNS